MNNAQRNKWQGTHIMSVGVISKKKKQDIKA